MIEPYWIPESEKYQGDSRKQSRIKRFKKDHAKQPLLGANSSVHGRIGYEYPTHKQMDAFEKFNIPPDVDPDLRNIVIDLNRAGYKTLGSCQGHAIGGRAFVSLAPTQSDLIKLIPKDVRLRAKLTKHMGRQGNPLKQINLSEIKGIFRKHGINKVNYVPPHWKKGTVSPFHAFVFKPILDMSYVMGG